jgi:hypothetical protein
LVAELEQAREETSRAFVNEQRQLELARAETSRAIAKEQRLLKQLDLIEKRGEKAVSIEEARVTELEALDELERGGASLEMSAFDDNGLLMSPFTWSASAGLPDDFWSSDPLALLGESAELAHSSSLGWWQVPMCFPN